VTACSTSATRFSTGTCGLGPWDRALVGTTVPLTPDEWLTGDRPPTIIRELSVVVPTVGLEREAIPVSTVEQWAPDVEPPMREGGSMSDRMPPQDVAAEQSVLGSMLLSKDAIADVIETIRGSDFYRPAHETIFEAAGVGSW
jgi:hypothetical protein